MADTKALLEQRKRTKRAKPTFVVKESKFSARVKKRWRFPRGKHSKVRQMHKGRPVLPSTGFGSPRAVRGLHASGLREVLVKNEAELLSLDASKDGAVISGRVGMKKKLALLKLAEEKKITILYADAAGLAKSLTARFDARKAAKKAKKAAKNKKEEQQKKVAEKKKAEAKEKTAEEKKKEEKKLAEKTITKKQ